MVLTHKPIEPIEMKPMAEEAQKQAERALSKFVPEKIVKLNESQREVSMQVAQVVRKLPGIESRPQITSTLDEIIKSKGDAILAAKAVIS